MKKNKIINIVKKYSLKIYRDKRINKKSFQDIGVDSLKTVEMITEIENKFKIQL